MRFCVDPLYSLLSQAKIVVTVKISWHFSISKCNSHTSLTASTGAASSCPLWLVQVMLQIFKKKKKGEKNLSVKDWKQTLPNMEEHMASNRWVGWALWQLGVFFMSCCGVFHTVLLSWGKAPTVGCELHRDALCLAPSPPCGFRQRPNAHHLSLCPTSVLHNSL